jgi:hypothetical protein
MAVGDSFGSAVWNGSSWRLVQAMTTGIDSGGTV